MNYNGIGISEEVAWQCLGGVSTVAVVLIFVAMIIVLRRKELLRGRPGRRRRMFNEFAYEMRAQKGVGVI
eukprot:14834784-Alexandrium_andersonii.AAC.1